MDNPEDKKSVDGPTEKKHKEGTVKMDNPKDKKPVDGQTENKHEGGTVKMDSPKESSGKLGGVKLKDGDRNTAHKKKNPMSGKEAKEKIKELIKKNKVGTNKGGKKKENKGTGDKSTTS